MHRIVHESVLADRYRNLWRWKAHSEQAVGGEQRTVGVARVVRGRVEEIERIELDSPTIGEPIAYVGADGVEWRGLEDAVLSEWPRADVTPPQCTEPAGLFAEGDTG
jgi:hypothetical protein